MGDTNGGTCDVSCMNTVNYEVNENGVCLLIECADGEYSNPDMKIPCTPCEAGKWTNINNDGCISCQTGQYSNPSNGTKCTSCIFGEELNENKNGCISCDIGEYSNETSNYMCKPCGVGEENMDKYSCEMCFIAIFQKMRF
jgi:hypothetical protein